MSAPPVVELVYPMPADWVPWLWAWLCEDRAANFDEDEPQTLEAFTAAVARRAAMGERRWGVRVNGAPVGSIAYQPMTARVGLAHICITRSRDAWRKALGLRGLMALPRRIRGSGVTAEAARQVGQCLRSEGIRKVCFAFHADNTRVGRFLEKLGAVNEGLLRDQVERDGRFLDLRLMALFLSDGGVKCPRG
jgi:RimJ/RimL family protein N-acetyltransferase